MESLSKNIPSKEEMLNALIERQGEWAVRQLQKSTVAVCGLGGLGSNIAIFLARAGVGKLILIDYDNVDVSNLHRQQYKAMQVGEQKPKAIYENIKEIAPYTECEVHCVKISEENAFSLLKYADAICEAFDSASEKAMLTNFVLENFPQKFLVAASGMAGIESGNSICTRKITPRFYLCGDGVSDVANGLTLIAPRVALCASHQALTVMRLLISVSETKSASKME